MTLGIIFGVMLVVALTLVLRPLLLPDAKTKGKAPLSQHTLAAATGGFVILGSVAIYLLIGNPDSAKRVSFPEGFGQGLFDQQEDPRLPSIEVMVDRLKERLAANPENLDGWATLGQSQMVLGRYGEAAETYRRAIALAPDTADFHSALGEAVTLEAGGVVGPAALEAFETALSIAPEDPVSLFYLGDYAFQQGQTELAFERWTSLYEAAPQDTPWLPILEERIETAARELDREPPAALLARREPATPSSAAEAIRQMSPDEQTAMIESMVAGLAARLEENPGDIEGWERLGRSYMVLERPDEAAQAYARVVDARPDSPVAVEAYAQALLSAIASKDQPVNTEMVAILERLERLDSRNSTALYYLGQAALERGDPKAARQYWQRLLSVLSPDSADAALVRERLNEIG